MLSFLIGSAGTERTKGQLSTNAIEEVRDLYLLLKTPPAFLSATSSLSLSSLCRLLACWSVEELDTDAARFSAASLSSPRRDALGRTLGALKVC